MQIGFTEEAPKKPKQSKTFEPIEAGTYNAEVADVKFTDQTPDFIKYNEQVKFRFKITEGEYKNRQFFKDVEAKITKDSNCELRLYLESILGVNELPESFVFNTDDLNKYVGLPCRIRISKYEAGERAKNPGEIRNAVDDVLAALPSQFSAVKDFEESF